MTAGREYDCHGPGENTRPRNTFPGKAKTTFDSRLNRRFGLCLFAVIMSRTKELTNYRICLAEKILAPEIILFQVEARTAFDYYDFFL